jgi:predicted HicB family RNase H-like nuclease
LSISNLPPGTKNRRIVIKPARPPRREGKIDLVLRIEPALYFALRDIAEQSGSSMNAIAIQRLKQT